MWLLGLVVLVVAAFLGLFYFLMPSLVKSRIADMELSKRDYLTADDLPSHQKILFVTAHQDDLEFLCGGTVPILIDRGNTIYLAVLTTGGRELYWFMPRFLSRRFTDQRRAEQLKAARANKVKEVFFYDHPDGGLKVDDRSKKEIADLIDRLKPNVVFAFDDEGWRGYNHPDHKTSSQIVREVLKDHSRGSNPRLYLFSTGKPDLIVDITNTFEHKWEVLQIYGDFRGWRKRLIRQLQEAMAERYGRAISVKYGEGYRLVTSER